MCLVIISHEKPEAKIAEKDIHCYKLIAFSPYSYSNILLKTPYICDDIELGVRNHESNPMRPKLDSYKSGKRGKWWEISGGGYYTYTNLEDAKNDAIYMQKYEISRKQYIVLHAVIPKGTKYYKGFCDGKSSYESKDVIYSRDVAWINRSAFSDFRDRLQYTKLRVETKDGRPNVKAMREKTIDQLTF